MHARSVKPIFAAALADDPAEIAATRKAGSTALHLAVAPTGASGTAGAGELQLEIVRLLLAAGATLADTDRHAPPWPTGSRASHAAACSGRSIRTPLLKTALARTRATRWGALTDRQRSWADWMSIAR